MKLRSFKNFIFFFVKCKIFRHYQYSFNSIIFYVQFFKSWGTKMIKFVEKIIQKVQKIALKLINWLTTHPHFCPKSPVTPWSSGLRRQTILDHLDKNWGESGVKNFFSFFSKFDLRSNFVFPVFFKPYVTFPFIYMAIFLKMASLFSYEPTV